MLRYLISWTTYSTCKAGFLVDYMVKSMCFYISTYMFYSFTIFFADKYMLEFFFSFFFKIFSLVGNKLQLLRKLSFIDLLKTTFYIFLYFLLILFMMFI